MRKNDAPVPQTVRERRDGTRLVLARDAEPADLLPPELNVLFGELFAVERLDVVDGRLVVRELIGRVLRVLGQLELRVPRDGALDGRESARDQVEERRFAGTVVTDNGDSDGERCAVWNIRPIWRIDSAQSTYLESMSIPTERSWYR